MGFAGVTLWGISKYPNETSGKLLLALGDPIKRAIIGMLVSTDNATPGEVARQLQKRYSIDRSTISMHITQLESLGVINREHDGKLYASNPDLLVEIIQTAREWASSYLFEAASVEAAAHYTQARRTGQRRRRASDRDDDDITSDRS